MFVDLQIQDSFYSQESIIIHGVSIYKTAQTKEKSNFQFQMCPWMLKKECPLKGICKYKVWVGGKNKNGKKCSWVELSTYKSIHFQRVDCIKNK